MKAYVVLASVILAGCAANGVAPTTTGCAQNPSRLTVTMTGNQKPEVDHPRACFPSGGKVEFAVPAQGAGRVYVIFKEERTPVIDQHGADVFFLAGPQAMNGKKFQLKKNDGRDPIDYPYMLVDLNKPSRPANDPIIVIDPE